jgi:hypothetical protein
VIYFDKSIVDWRVIADAWLKDRPTLEVDVSDVRRVHSTVTESARIRSSFQCLRVCFDKVMEPLMNFLDDECSR